MCLVALCAGLVSGGEPPERVVLPRPAAGTAACAGVWRMQPGGAVFAVEDGGRRGEYRLRILDSPDLSVPPGAVMGTLTETAVSGVYDAVFFRRPGAATSGTHRFMVDAGQDAGRMTMRPYRASARLSFRRWFSYLFRVGVEASDRPDGNDGAVRIAPLPSDRPVVL